MKLALTLLLILTATAATAQTDVPPFHEYDPPSTLVLPEHPVVRAKYPFVDVHGHQWEMPSQDLGLFA